MGKNIIYCFTGTGNSLYIAKRIAAEIGNCEIKAIGKSKKGELQNNYEKIGFVFPVYFLGAPSAVNQFVAQLKIMQNTGAYFFAVATYGFMAGYAGAEVLQLLANKGAKNFFEGKLKMHSNFIVAETMREQTANEAQKEEQNLQQLLKNIASGVTNKRRKQNRLIRAYHNWQLKRVPNLDKNFSVSNNCTSCGICKAVCPVGNIDMPIGIPQFNHKCQQCMACIQYCSQKAINYKDKTQNKNRYQNAHIKWTELKMQNQTNS